MNKRISKLFAVLAVLLLLISALPVPTFAAGSATITAEVKHERTVTVPPHPHGTVIILAPDPLHDGDTVRFTVTPDPGYVLSAVYCNGEDVTADMVGDTYTVTVSGDVVFRAVFAAKAGPAPVPDGGETGEASTMPFTDVPEDEYFYEAVAWAAENGITNGTGKTTFSPYVPVTRAEVVTFLWRTAGCPAPEGDAGRFVDVEAGSFYEKAVAWGIEQGVVKGTSPTTFSPDMVCTRAHIVAFLARFAGVADEAAGYTHSFTDVWATDYFHNAVAWAKDSGVTVGTTAATFSPNLDCTRAQAVTFLWRWMVR